MAGVPASTALQWALEIEANGKAFYTAVAAKSADREVKALFEDLAYQEERHAHTFERMLAKAPASAGLSASTESYHHYLETALSGALFGDTSKGVELAGQAENEEQALQAAIAFEKDTLLFFYDLLGMAPPMQQAAISAIIDEEKSHVSQLTKVLESGPFVL